MAVISSERFLVAAGLAPKSLEPRFAGFAGELLALAVAAGLCVFLLRAGRDCREI